MRTQEFSRVLLLLLVATLFSALAANAQSTTTVIPLGIPGVGGAQLANASAVCGIGWTMPDYGPSAQSIKMVDISAKTTTTLVYQRGQWNSQLEILDGVTCPHARAWFTTRSRQTGKVSVWKIENGVPMLFLRPNDEFGDAKYIDGARLIGNDQRAVILGLFATTHGVRWMAYTLSEDPRLVMDYGDQGRTAIYEACVTDESLVATVQLQFGGPFGAEQMVTRARGGLLWRLETVPDLGNDGSTDIGHLNLTHTVGCSNKTAGYMIRSRATTVAKIIGDRDNIPTTVFSGTTTSSFPMSNIWGLTIDADDNVSFAMSVRVDYGSQAVFRIRNGQAVAVAVEGVDFNHVPLSGATPFALGKRLLMFLAPMGGGYEIQ